MSTLLYLFSYCFILVPGAYLLCLLVPIVRSIYRCPAPGGFHSLRPINLFEAQHLFPTEEVWILLVIFPSMIYLVIFPTEEVWFRFVIFPTEEVWIVIFPTEEVRISLRDISYWSARFLILYLITRFSMGVAGVVVAFGWASPAGFSAAPFPTDSVGIRLAGSTRKLNPTETLWIGWGLWPE